MQQMTVDSETISSHSSRRHLFRRHPNVNVLIEDGIVPQELGALLVQFVNQGICVNLAPLTPFQQPNQCCDLIVLLLSNQRKALNLVIALRQATSAPILLIADSQSIESCAAAVFAGADATLSPETPVDVIVAHSQALMRRWQSQN